MRACVCACVFVDAISGAPATCLNSSEQSVDDAVHFELGASFAICRMRNNTNHLNYLRDRWSRCTYFRRVIKIVKTSQSSPFHAVVLIYANKVRRILPFELLLLLLLLPFDAFEAVTHVPMAI